MVCITLRSVKININQKEKLELVLQLLSLNDQVDEHIITSIGAILEQLKKLNKRLDEIEKKLGTPILIPRLEYDPKLGPTCHAEVNPLVWNDDL